MINMFSFKKYMCTYYVKVNLNAKWCPFGQKLNHIDVSLGTCP